eukprot:11227446-Lingulodinium_polyedra.AAC.1
MLVTLQHPLSARIVKHAAWDYNRSQLCADGRTSYERFWNTTFNITIGQLCRSSTIAPVKPTVTWES